MITTLSHREARAFLDKMTNEQLARVWNRMTRHRAAFHDIRDAVTHAVADELAAAAANRQPDDPGVREFPEPNVGKYPGWLAALIWMTAFAASWLLITIMAEWVLR